MRTNILARANGTVTHAWGVNVDTHGQIYRAATRTGALRRTDEAVLSPDKLVQILNRARDTREGTALSGIPLIG
eukprot:5050753-Prymnesium_polylepis.1